MYSVPFLYSAVLYVAIVQEGAQRKFLVGKF